jgi:hypothetical protein
VSLLETNTNDCEPPNPYRGKRVASQRSNNKKKPHRGREKKRELKKDEGKEHLYYRQ